MVRQPGLVRGAKLVRMDVIESLPLFPLSDVVLLPEVSVPLYIFEPRYRQMTREALDGERLIGMVTVRPDSLDQMAGAPPIFAVGCLGRIAHASERPDGTFQILLLGERRFRILAEHPREGERLYRTARVELLRDPEVTTSNAADALDRSRAALLELLGQLVDRTPGGDRERIVAGFEDLEPARLVNALTRSIGFLPIERQQLLEADSIESRFEIMIDLLRFRLAESGLGGTGSAPLPN